MTMKTKGGSKKPPLKVRIVGPSVDREKQLARLDGAERSQYLNYASIRDRLVALSKQLQVTEKKGKPRSKRSPIKLPTEGRARLHKADDGTRTAPTTRTDQDTAIGYDFVDAVIPPPYPFDAIASLYENSGSLQRNIEAMAANVDGFGYHFEAIIDFSHPDVNDRVRELMFLERLETKNVHLKDLDEKILDELEPTLDEVKKTRRLWERIAMVERHQLASFFESLHPRYAFTRIRTDMRKTLELLGNAGWEILRQNRDDVYSQIEQVYNVPFANLQLVAQDRFPTPVKVKIKKGAVRWDELEFRRYFRRFCQLGTVGTPKTYYKEFGDPRIVSRTTGKYFPTLEGLREKEGDRAKPANEILHFLLESPIGQSPYGFGRWCGEMLSVLGTRASEEVNFLYFDNKAIPPMVLLVSGGQLSESSVNRLEKFLTERISGRKNFHKVLVIEGIPAGSKESPGDIDPSNRLRLEIKPLTSEMLQDGLFAEYDAANQLKIGRAFRQPGLLTGDQRDANRSTADVLKGLVEEGVYQPARDLFDSDMDRLFLSNLGIRFWKFKTNAPAQRYPNDLVVNATKALMAGAITPNEARPVIGQALARELPHRSEAWANTPPALSAAAASTGGTPGEGSFDNPTQDPPPPDQPVDPMSDSIAKGAVLARGQTNEEDGHFHVFKLVQDGERARVVTEPAGDDLHTHPDEVVKIKRGGYSREILDVANGHSHEVTVRYPADGRSERVEKATRSINALKAGLERDLGLIGADFFKAE